AGDIALVFRFLALLLLLAFNNPPPLARLSITEFAVYPQMVLIFWSDFIPRKGEYLVEKCSGGIHPTF
ncbi:hypothetical protein, partial [Microcystis sp. M099S2]|uniref:hypothetical protein n=1 Tax=Microcystis sp. M099S2 TaxID=2771178 RepID=UPI002590A17A